MIKIKKTHWFYEPLSIFPAMGVSCSVEMGRARMSNADMNWVIYDQDPKEKKFVKALKIVF